MEYVVGAVVFLVCFFLGGIYFQKKAAKHMEARIRENFGHVPDIEFSHEKYESIGYYQRTMAQKKPEDEEHTTIDDITWHDLDMDKVYLRMCATNSSIGDEYLYYLLRTPLLSEEKLKEREKLIRFLDENEETRVKLQMAFSQAGRLSKVSVYEYLSRLDSLDNEGNFKHFLSMGMIFAAIGLIFFEPMYGVIATFAVFFYNVITYFRRKGEIENYYAVVAYIIRTVDIAKRICSLDDTVLRPYSERLLGKLKLFKSITRGAGIIVSKKSNGDIIEVLLDYIRMGTHIDLIRFNVMLSRLKDKKDDFEVIYETIGLLDSMTAVASFRKLMGVWCIPELKRHDERKDGKGAGGCGIETENIYHPMIAEPVKNSFKENRNVILTGSNASGKSTFIKTIAINSILAQSINTVLADSYSAYFFKCMTSMALTDNLSEGESYYIVEIKSLKRICDSLNENVPLLIFIDEVLRGTNTLERIAASSRILYYIGQRNCMLFAATHDIELTYILENSFCLYHFEESVENDGVFFDYKIKDGRAVTRNAILLLKMLGFDSCITGPSGEAADEFLSKGEWGIIP